MADWMKIIVSSVDKQVDILKRIRENSHEPMTKEELTEVIEEMENFVSTFEDIESGIEEKKLTEVDDNE